MRVTVSGGEESGEVSSGDMVNEAVAGGSSMLAERLLRRTGRGTSTLGFKDWREREKVRKLYIGSIHLATIDRTLTLPLLSIFSAPGSSSQIVERSLIIT